MSATSSPLDVHFLLLAGSYHGAECWEEVVERLRRRGASVRATDFIELDRERLVDSAHALAALLAPGRRNIVVGHSAAGHLASAHAELYPERLLGVVYVTAALLGDGASAADIPRLAEEEPARPDYATDGTFRWCRVETAAQRERVKQYFYNTTPQARAERALAALRRQRRSILEDPLRLSTARFGSVNKSYVKCTRDRVIFPSVQERMVARAGTVERFALDADHSPFFSAPERLTELLVASAHGFTAASAELG